MATKLFKSEYHAGGEIRVTTNNKKGSVVILNCDNEYEYDINNPYAKRKIDNLLFELTSTYYAGEILKWIESKIDFKPTDEWFI